MWQPEIMLTTESQSKKEFFRNNNQRISSLKMNSTSLRTELCQLFSLCRYALGEV